MGSANLFPIDTAADSSTLICGVAPSGAQIIAYDKKPPRVVGLAGALVVSVNGVIGSGIFALPALLFVAAGSFAPYAILIFAVFYGSIMAVIAKLSTVFRQSGGIQLYAQHAFGPLVGFQIGWFGLAVNMSGAAANFHVLVSYLAAIFPVFDDPAVRLAMIAALVASFTFIAISGTTRSIGAIAIGTLLKLSPLALFCIIGFAQNGVPTEVVLPTFSEIETIALLMAFAFSGCDFAVLAAGEVKEPRKIMMRAIFINLTAVAVFYALVQLAYNAIAPEGGNMDSPLAAAAAQAMGPNGSLMIALAAIFSVATLLLNSFVAFPRMIYGMARRGLMPHFLAFVSPRFETPARAIGGFGLIVALLALTGSFATLATLMVSVEQLMFASAIAALIIMWQRNDAGLRDMMDWRWVIIIPVAIGMVIWLLWQVPPDAVLNTAVLIAMGLVLYWLSRRSAEEQEAIELPEGREREA